MVRAPRAPAGARNYNLTFSVAALLVFVFKIVYIKIIKMTRDRWNLITIFQSDRYFRHVKIVDDVAP